MKKGDIGVLMSPFEHPSRSTALAKRVSRWYGRRRRTDTLSHPRSHTLPHTGAHTLPHTGAHVGPPAALESSTTVGRTHWATPVAHARSELIALPSRALAAHLRSTRFPHARHRPISHRPAPTITHIRRECVELRPLCDGEHVAQILSRFQLRDLGIGSYTIHAIERGACLLEIDVTSGGVHEIRTCTQYFGFVRL